MTAHRDSLPSCYPVQERSAGLTSKALELGSYTYSQLEAIVVFTTSFTCLALGILLWIG